MLPLPMQNQRSNIYQGTISLLWPGRQASTHSYEDICDVVMGSLKSDVMAKTFRGNTCIYYPFPMSHTVTN